MARTAGSHSEITGPRIRAAAERLFARHGYAAVSMRQIAAEVGVQAGALYQYTPDKQSLLVDLMCDHIEELLAIWQAIAPAADPRARLVQFVECHISYHFDRPDALFIAYMELRNVSPENFARVEGIRGRYEAVLEGILRAGVAEGAFAVPDLRLATMALMAMLNGIIHWYREGGRLGRAQVAAIYADMVLRAVGAAGAPPFAVNAPA